ncbi:LysE family translocator [Aestuariispira insulae]|uniref:Threonine/homoserine/homoserine lactone efflux protein n=1 Tax=Aestuariispira insulae TaxID=1461337 RepID=A0A3D9HEM2_9PROT|nr:LysE family translocator [Aestuariispira insulae]RED47691.1 threonine/homoserine/homoserine lactone efflux protein [Aestuariispira insulae]
MLSVILPMSAFLLVAAITPGPVNIIATSTGAAHGFRRALPHVFGASASYCLICLLAGTGLSGFLSGNPKIAQAMQLAGGAFLLYLAWRIASAPVEALPSDDKPTPPELTQGFLNGFLAQGLNPKAWLAALSGAGLFLAGSPQPFLSLMLYCGLAFTICVGSIGTWAGLGSLLQAFLARPKRAKFFNLIMAGLLAACVIMMFFQG